MSKPRFSVIIPVFNSGSTLAKAIDSAINQTYENIELIVIDGGSTDNSVDIVNERKNSIEYFTTEKDNGVYDAMNKGIQIASGNWIYLLGADDELADNNVIENIASQIVDQDVLIYGKVENVGKQHSRVPDVHRSELSGKIIWRNTIHQQSAFYHESLFDDFAFDTQFKILADYDFHLHLFRSDVAGKFADVLVAKCGATGLSKNFNWSLYSEEIKMKKNHFDGSMILYWTLQIPFILLKFLYKRITA